MHIVHVEKYQRDAWPIKANVDPLFTCKVKAERLDNLKSVDFFKDSDDLADFHVALLKVEGVACLIKRYATAPADEFTLYCDIDEADAKHVPIRDIYYGLVDNLGLLSYEITWRNDHFLNM